MLTRGAKKFPENPVFRVGLARVFNLKAASMFQASGKMDSHVVFPYEDSIREAQRVLKKWPKNRDARLILANSYYSIGEWEKAKKESDELVKRFPTHAGGYIIMGDLALHHFKLLRQRTSDEGADTSAETIQKVAGAREAAMQNYQKAIDLAPKRAIAYTKLGEVFAWNGDVKKALAAYFNALRIDPAAGIDHGWIQNNTTAKDRFARYEKLGNEYMAQPDFDKNKAGVFAWYGAAALIADKQYQLGEELYAISVQLNSTYLSAYYYAMYSAYFYRKDERMAMQYAVEYAKAAPIEFADLVRSLTKEPRERLTGLIRYMAKLASDSKAPHLSRDLNHVLAAIVDTADAWNNFAFMARESGQYDESETAYRNALAIEPTSGQLMNDLAVILHYHRKTLAAYDEAAQLYKGAIAAAKQILRGAKAAKEVKEIAKQTITDANFNLAALKPVHAAAKKAAKQAAAAKRKAARKDRKKK